MEATKRPFIQEQQLVYSEDINGNIIAVCDCTSGKEYKEDLAIAELIVRAVNSHEILMKTGHTLAILALQSIRYTHNPDFRDAVDDLLATIKQAEGGE